jgi:glycosyltransferase involved in cell wall biosynthesis
MSAVAQSVEDVQKLYLATLERLILDTPSNLQNSAKEHPPETAPESEFQLVSRRLRLSAIRELAEHTITNEIPGDFVLAGPDVGDACFMLRAVLKAYAVVDRRIVVLIDQSRSVANQSGIDASAMPSSKQPDEPASNEARIKELLTRLDLLDDQIVFLAGSASATFANELHRSIAFLVLVRLSAQALYEALTAFYPSISTGGAILIASPLPIAAAQGHVARIRAAANDEGVLVPIDKDAVFWCKQTAAERDVITAIRTHPRAGDSDRPFWSVIIPLYERRQYLKQCLDSVLGQDPGPSEMEILVADDASRGDMADFVHSLGRGRVSFSRNQVNRGQHATTNEAISRSRGRWIHILHDDDWVLPGFYATLRKGVEQAPPVVGLAFTMYSNFNQADESLWTPPAFRDTSGLMEASFLVRLIKSNPLNFPAIVYRRETFETVGGFREDLPCAGDWEFYVRASMKYRWHHETANLARYRTNLVNLTKEHFQNGLRARDFRRVLDGFAKLLPPELAARVLPHARVIHAREFTNIAVACMKGGNEPIAFRYLSEALRLDANLAARPEFAEFLKQPNAEVMRFKIRNALLRSVS